MELVNGGFRETVVHQSHEPVAGETVDELVGKLYALAWGPVGEVGQVQQVQFHYSIRWQVSNEWALLRCMYKP